MSKTKKRSTPTSSSSSESSRLGSSQSNTPADASNESVSMTVVGLSASKTIPYSHDSLVTSNDNVRNESEMIEDEIFDDTDLDGDGDTTRLRFYSDIEVDAGESESVSQSPTKTSPSEKAIKKQKRHREPSRLSLKDRIRCIRMCSRYKTLADVQKAWKQTYGTEAPCRKTMAALNEKFELTGSVSDLVRTGRPKSTRTAATIARVEDAVRKDPNKSIRVLARELGINQSAIHRIKRDYEDNRNTLKSENKKLKDKLNEALRRIILLERRLLNESGAVAQLKLKNDHTTDSTEVETLVFDTMPLTVSGEATNILTTTGHGHIEARSDSSLSSIISVNSPISIPPLLRLQQQGHETIHIITLPQGSSHQLVSLDGNGPVQISIPSEVSGSSKQDVPISSTFETSASSTNA